jgi:hypothetical protein
VRGYRGGELRCEFLLWSSTRGEVDRVNGVTAKVDTRPRSKTPRITRSRSLQTDKYLILRDLQTGQVTALDLTTLQVSAVMPSTPGLGVSVALYGDTAFVIDSVLGQVRQLDPRTLSPTGDAVILPRGITPAASTVKAVVDRRADRGDCGLDPTGAPAAPTPRWRARSASPARATTSHCPHWTPVWRARQHRATALRRR